MARKSESREVHDFSEVRLLGGGEVIVDVNPDAAEGLAIEADELLLLRLRSDVKEGVLRLGYSMEWWEWLTFWWQWITIPDKRVVYRVSAKRLQGLVASGSGKLTANRIEGERCRLMISGSGRGHVEAVHAQTLNTTISGSGDVEWASGSAAEHAILISGSGSVRAGGVATQSTRVTISGSGNAEVDAENKLEIRISGSGNVTYRGQPEISQHVSGSGRIRSSAG